jgi:hypothetical protein
VDYDCRFDPGEAPEALFADFWDAMLVDWYVVMSNVKILLCNQQRTPSTISYILSEVSAVDTITMKKADRISAWLKASTVSVQCEN